MEEALTTLLEPVANGRRYWRRAPQQISVTEGPYLVLSRISAPRDYSMAGPTGYVASRVQIDIYAATYTAARDVGNDVRDALSGFRGSAAAAVIQGIFIDDVRDLDAGDAGEVNQLFRVSIDIMVHHDE